MSRPTILRVPPLSPQLNDAVGEQYDAVDPDDLPARADDVVGIVCTNTGRVGSDLIDALPNLGVIANHGVGYDNIDVPVALARGIAVSNTPEVLDDAVAETAIALLLGVRRELVAADRFVRAGRWTAGAYPLTAQVAGSRVGIIGLGRIGRAVATRLEALGCEVSYHNRRQVPDVAYPYAASAVELAAAVDSLVVVVPGGAATDGLVDRAVLDALGPDGVLVNIARGSVVDQPALVAALQEGRLGGAGLDVYADEPNVPAELVALDTVVLLPHVGSGTHVTRAAMRELTLRNLASWLADRTLHTPIPEMEA
ncbi:2-hydroxyacid dehydrogenase [Nocardioides nitrophenolicus]|uniref:2-hydroxyacid dehydrogenase n=1 Tax=Nocardioides nitrophenolicus TaxID=60489 RepID=UPI001958C4C2|nr:2-hydroxyacid dehydrogenase [Nocardioides nitrophenolicus]MBM7515638.1 lactate dehydrogenase-like 2-hydroxyacid dehydrogenase [Nocardioides nitrophenolicus]